MHAEMRTFSSVAEVPPLWLIGAGASGRRPRNDMREIADQPARAT